MLSISRVKYNIAPIYKPFQAWKTISDYTSKARQQVGMVGPWPYTAKVTLFFQKNLLSYILSFVLSHFEAEVCGGG